jgi:hypothetical protein
MLRSSMKATNAVLSRILDACFGARSNKTSEFQNFAVILDSLIHMTKWIVEDKSECCNKYKH